MWKLALVSWLAIGCGGGADDPAGTDGGMHGADAPGPPDTGIHPLVASQAELAHSLYPLAVGLAWTYDVDAGSTTCGAGPRTIRVRDRAMTGGQTIYTTDTPCDYFGDGSNQVRVVGDDVYSQVATGAESKVLAVPLAQGASWQSNASVTIDWIREMSPVTVPAGTFDDCWTAHALPWESWSTYCRGVGLVRSTSGDDVGAGETGFGIELTSYDFSALVD